MQRGSTGPSIVTRVTNRICFLGIGSGNPSREEGDMYSRTQNENGTYNTRCLFCFMTIASDVESSEELDKLETRHVCPERALAELLAQGTPGWPIPPHAGHH